jgi:hypothetical protein
MRATLRSPSAQTPGHRSEIDLLRWCSGNHADAARTEQIRRLLQRHFDWDYLLEAALAHGIFPQLYCAVQAAAGEPIPTPVLDQFRVRFHAIAWRNLVLTTELVRLVGLLEGSGFRTMAFKGPVLAASAYGDISRRQFADLDILVDPKDILLAKDALLTAGYRLEGDLSPLQAARLLRSVREHHFLMTSQDGRISVELHWAVMQTCFAFPIGFQQLWDGRVPVVLDGSSVFGPGPEEMLLILCAHGAKHDWSQLRMIADVNALIRSAPALDWARVIGQARALHGSRLLALGLLLAHDLLGTPLSDEVVRRVRSDPGAQSLATAVVRQLTEHLPKPLGSQPVSALYLQARERLSDRIRVCVRLERIPPDVHRATLPLPARWLIYLSLALLPRDWDRDLVPLPRTLSFLAYLVRPVRLLAKYARSLIWRK